MGTKDLQQLQMSNGSRHRIGNKGESAGAKAGIQSTPKYIITCFAVSLYHPHGHAGEVTVGTRRVVNQPGHSSQYDLRG